MEILTLLLLLAKSVLMPFEEQAEGPSGSQTRDSAYLQPGAEKPTRKRNSRRGDSRAFRSGYHCPQPAT